MKKILILPISFLILLLTGQVLSYSDLIITNPSTRDLPQATADENYTFTFTAEGGIPPYTWQYLRKWPDIGLTLSSNGIISGTPKRTGTFSLGVRVIGSNFNGEFGNQSQGSYNLSIKLAPGASEKFQIIPITATVAVGSTMQYKVFSGGVEFTNDFMFSTDDPNVAKKTNTQGRIECLRDGSTIVRAVNNPGGNIINAVPSTIICGSGTPGGTTPGGTTGGTGGAPGIFGEGINIPNPLGNVTNFQDLLNAIINFIFVIGMALAPVMFIVAGFLWITAVGNSGQIQKAKDLMLYTVIGLVVLLIARGLVTVIKSVLGAP